jgi:hypothetical protein
MSWIRGTASNHIDLSNDLVEAMTGSSLQTVDSIAVGGSSYVVGDILTLSGGTSTIAAQVEVTAVSVGAVTAVRRYNDGVYTVTPSDPVSTTGGSGTGCTLNCTFASNGWTANRNTTWSGSEREVLMEGSGSGTDEIFVGWRTYSDPGSSRYNLELHGMTGYLSGSDFDEQPNISPGFHDGSIAAVRAGCHLLAASTSMQYWLSVTSYRVVGEVKVGSAYFPIYMGWGNRFATETEYPYPLVVAANSSRWNTNASQGRLTSSLTDPWKDTDTEGTTNGPLMVLDVDNVWRTVWNGNVSASARTAATDRNVVPCQRPAGTTGSIPDEDKFMALTIFPFWDLVSESGLTDTPNANLHATPSTPNDQRALWPTIIVFTNPASIVLMELDDVYWISAFGGLASEDRIIDGSGNVYRVFQNCNRTDIWAFLAVKEG